VPFVLLLPVENGNSAAAAGTHQRFCLLPAMSPALSLI